jgi:hypothetical protein
MKKGKKTIRLTESEMITMIERIVNEVKREKRNQISESRRRMNNRRYNSQLNEQQTKMTVINVDLISDLVGQRLATIEDPDPDSDLIAFPSSGIPTAGDPAILNRRGAVYQTKFIKGDPYASSGADTILLGKIGKLTGDQGNWGIADNSALKVFTYTKSNAPTTTSMSGGIVTSGNLIIPEEPYITPTTVTDPAPIISTLTKAKFGTRQGFEGTSAQKYIADLVKLFQTMNQLTDVGITTDSIMKYTREKLS